MGIHEKLFVCEICQKQFSSKQTLKKHKEEFHVIKDATVFMCNICDLKCSNKRNLVEHMKIHAQQKEVLRCKLCSDEINFKHTRNLRRHYLSVHKVIPEYYLTLRLNPMPELVCDICGEKFGRKDSLDKHKALQLCSTFNCSLCKFSSNNRDELDEHLNVPHIRCEYCDFQTIYQRNLVRHLKKHI